MNTSIEFTAVDVVTQTRAACTRARERAISITDARRAEQGETATSEVHLCLPASACPSPPLDRGRGLILPPALCGVA
eukprot:COSAG03_NODE_390_length_8302_cov_70.582317_9_plen_77_part_00